ncbi:MAG: hypothetical protein HWE11_09690 [Gammaproteobacteria bacterium]|nr:hypothetical protein [Gammaproteobacteria bacterium]
MNLLLLVNRDIAAFTALQSLLPKLAFANVVIGLSSQVNPKQVVAASESDPRIQQLKQFERGGFIAQPPEAQNFDPFTELATLWHIKCFCANNINQAIIDSQFPMQQIDLIISIRFGVILQPAVIMRSALGVINLHSGILPQYRGVMATFWSMLNDEKYMGTSLHFIDSAEIDRGQLIKISQQPIDYSRSYIFNVLQLYPPGVADILVVVNQLQKKQQPQTISSNQEMAYYSFPTIDDYQQFWQKGLHLVEQQDEVELADLMSRSREY